MNQKTHRQIKVIQVYAAYESTSGLLETHQTKYSSFMSFMRSLVLYIGVSEKWFKKKSDKKSVPIHGRYYFFHCHCFGSSVDIPQLQKEEYFKEHNCSRL